MRRLVLVLALALVLTGCGGFLGVTPAPEPETEPVAPDVVTPFQAYAAEQRDVFGGLYLDDGIVVLQFTDELTRHDAALHAQGIGAARYRLERVEHSEAALTELQDRIVEDMTALQLDGYEFISCGIDLFTNRVELTVKSNEPGAEDFLKDRYGAGNALALHLFPLIEEWEQPGEGDGWRLLAHGRVTEAYSVRVATGADDYAVLWTSLGLPGDAPAVDFGANVVASFNQGIGSSCPEVRLDAVAVDGDVVHPSFSDPLNPRACTADLVGGQAFVVALDRASLPPAPYRVRLVPAGERLPCGGDCGDGLTSEVVVP